jgi:tripartite ATP-independent transporter DctM subunit
MDGLWVILLFACLVVLGTPVAFALLIPSVLWLLAADAVSVTAALPRLVAPIDSFILTAVPLFILMGTLAEASGLAERLYTFVAAALRGVRGSIAYANVVASFGFSWMSGSAVADAGSMARVEVPAMIRRGYDPGYSVGLTAASSILSPVMPPSIPAVLYAATANVSLGAMFLGGVGPAVVILLVLLVWVFATTRHRTSADEFGGVTATLRTAFVKSAYVFPLPVLLLGGIISGLFTPTEAAAVSVVYVCLAGVLSRALSASSFARAVGTAAVTSAQILFLVACSSLFSWILAYEKVTVRATEALVSVTGGDQGLFLLASIVVLLLIGTVIDPASGLLIMVPVLLPAALELGLSSVHFGVVMILALMIGLLTPPVGLVLYVLSAASGLGLSIVMRGVVPYLLVLFIALLVVAYVPGVTMTIVEFFGR